VRLTAIDAQAEAEGLRIGQTLADARALLPVLLVANADPAADARALAELARWAERFSPFIGLDPDGEGLWLDVRGTDRLFGGASRLAADLCTRLGRLGYAARAAVAPTPGAAWALAHYAQVATPVIEAGGIAAALAPLPPAALRLAPALAGELA